MEFLIVAAVVVIAIVTAAFLSAVGQDGSESASTARRLIENGFVALVTLAYAAAGGVEVVRNAIKRKKPSDQEDTDGE